MKGKHNYFDFFFLRLIILRLWLLNEGLRHTKNKEFYVVRFKPFRCEQIEFWNVEFKVIVVASLGCFGPNYCEVFFI